MLERQGKPHVSAWLHFGLAGVLTQTGLACFSFIRYLLGQDFPNQRIGPEPTTDRFVSVMYVVFKPFVCCLAAPLLDVLSIMAVHLFPMQVWPTSPSHPWQRSVRKCTSLPHPSLPLVRLLSTLLTLAAPHLSLSLSTSPGGHAVPSSEQVWHLLLEQV